MNRDILETAVAWHVRLNAEPDDTQTQQAWRHWLAESPLHRQAWARVERLQQRLGNLPNQTALYALNGVHTQRRAFLRSLGALALLGGGGWAASVQVKEHGLLADLRTAPGERRALTLDDGSQLHLNTRTTVDVHFSPTERKLQLHAGELLVETASDALSRPFYVDTPEGRIEALGTRFSVRHEAKQCRVGVYRHAVALTPRQQSSAALHLPAGHTATFDSTRITAAPSPLPLGEDAWLNGMLSIVDWPLERVANELARYRRGYVSCDPAIAQLRVSGALKIDDTAQAFDALAASLPIEVRYLTRYWVRLQPA
ncbi:FecR domain-containing protein [Halomonas dongshanensis]|uniref:FecR domain-containing protein n=1 Tax=Halomonas dongshanensis TaxID=2890835 RepID=A0ABT2E9D4_9GAMM|nr:FecR domain-containing protein [Halomonas dongshanensis]MCS2608176.1 FecR domain-containing protein [Halomonas dongshanensis]